MTSVHYIDDYTFRIPNLGWPPNVNINQSSPYNPYLNNDLSAYPYRQQQLVYQYSGEESQPEVIRPLTIRRHEPGSTDPPIPKAPIPVIFLTPMSQPTLPSIFSEPIVQPNIQSTPSEVVLHQSVQSTPPELVLQHSVQLTPSEPIPQSTPIPQSIPIQKPVPVENVPIDPNDRPIRPMKDTTVYFNPSSPAKPLPSIKRIHSASSRQTGPFQLPPKPPVRGSSLNKIDRIESASRLVQSPLRNQPSRSQSALKPIHSPSQNQLSRLQSATIPVAASPSLHKPDVLPSSSPSRTQMRNVSARRPIKTDIKTIFDNDLPPPHNQRHPILIHERDENDNRHPGTNIRSAPKRIFSYQGIPLITAEEMQNRRLIRTRPSLSETIIYRT